MLTGGKQNILELWKAHFNSISSDLSIKKVVERDLVDAIYMVIKDFWGEEHFNVNPVDLIQKGKFHVIIPALSKKTLSGFYYLLTTATLIDRAKSENIAAYNKLYAVRYRTDAFREILFEIYIEWVLWHNNIPYETEVLVGNQVKEGYCLIDDTTYLIECKKKYSPATQQRKLKQFISGEVFKLAPKIKIGFEYICIIKFKSAGLDQQQISKTFKEFKSYITDRTQNMPAAVLEYDLMRFEIVPFDMETVTKLKDNVIDNDIYFFVKILMNLPRTIYPNLFLGQAALSAKSLTSNFG